MIRLCTCSGGSASNLRRSGNRLAIASCKICSVKPSVAARRSIPKSMVSTEGLEFTSFFNPDLTWKKVSKGNRSASRRARKPFPKSVERSENSVAGSVEASDKNSNRVVDMPVSESEKLGVTVLGRRFSDKIEHVPIKKRRVFFRSPSPPPRIPSPHQDEPGTGWISNDRPALGLKKSNAKVNSWKIHETPDENEDFSGISILAAAACSNHIDDEGSFGEKFSYLEGPVEVLANLGSHVTEKSCVNDLKNCTDTSSEGIALCTPGTMEEPVKSTERPEDCTEDIARDAVNGKNMESTVLQDTNTNASSKLPTSEGGGTVTELESASRDDRFHWDLNVIMDVWENPCVNPIVDTRQTSVQGTRCDDSMQSENVDRGTKDAKCSTKVLPLKDVDRLEDPVRLVPGLLELEASKAVDQTSSSQGMVLSSEIKKSTNDLVQVTKLVCDQREPSPSVPDGNIHVNHSSSAGGSIPCETPSEQAGHVTSLTNVLKKEESDCGADSAETEGVETVILENSLFQKCDVIVSDPVISRRTCSNDESSNRNSGLLVELTAPNTTVNLDVTHCETLKPWPDGLGLSDGLGLTQASQKCEELCTLDASVTEDEHVANANAEVQDVRVTSKDVFILDTNEVALVHSDSEISTHKARLTPRMLEKRRAMCSLSSDEACRSNADPVNSPGKVALEDDPFDDCEYDSDVSHNAPEPVAETEKVIELRSGYESQYEDGELRESIEHNWEDAGEEVETENVDYESDNRDTNGYKAPEDNTISISIQIEKGEVYRQERYPEIDNFGFKVQQSNLAKRGELGSCAIKDVVKAGNSTMKLSGWDKVPEGCRNSAGITITEVTRLSSELVDKDKACINSSRSNGFDDPNLRGIMEFGSLKCTGRGGSSLHMHGRGQGTNRPFDSSRENWGQNRQNSPTYYGPLSSASKNAAAAAAAKLENNGFIVARDGTIIKSGSMGPSTSGRIHRQSTNASSQVGHGPNTRRGSPIGRDEVFAHNGLGTVREVSPCRSRPERYGPRLVRTVPRERHNGFPPDEGIDSSLIYPINRREAPHLSQPCKRPRPRSRTRSPNMWSSPRRRYSRSPPSFRPDIRMDKVRSPHRRPGYGPDHMISEFASIPRRRHGSPQHSSRWTDDNRKDSSVDYFRDHIGGYKQQPSSVSWRGSPERVFKRNHVRSSDEYYKRPMHTGRLRDMDGNGRRPNRYDELDSDKKKNGERYGPMNPIRRRYDTNEPVKRFQYDEENDFEIRKCRNKDISGFHGRGNYKEDYVQSIDNNRVGDNAARGSREDKSNFRYGRDVKYTENNSKSFAECEDELALKRRRL